MSLPGGSRFQRQQAVYVSNRNFEHSMESSTYALFRIAHGIQRGLINKALVFGLLLLVAESLLIAHFQTGAALTLLRDTPPLAVLTGTLANVAPILIPLVGTGVCSVGLLELSGGDVRHGFNQVGLGIIVLAAALIFIDRTLVSPWLVLPLVIVAMLAVILGMQLRNDHTDNDSVESFRRILQVTVVALISGFILSNTAVTEQLQSPYLPTERITITTDSSTTKSIIGYVVGAGSNPHWVTVLTDDTRSIRMFKSDRIAEREVCSIDSAATWHPWWPLFETGTGNSIPACSR